MTRIFKAYILSLFIILLTATVSFGSESVHIVKSGDSLWSIARSNGVTVDQLKKVNGLNSANLQIGNKIIINHEYKAAPAAVTVSGTVSYTVKAGDSLWTIARSHNMMVARLKELNGLSSDSLKIGQKLNTGTGSINAMNTVAVTPSRSGENIQGERIVELAASYLGTPYAYGGQSPSGFDCSGFTWYIYKQFGHTLPRTAAGQYESGMVIERTNLEVGDLVFFTCSGSQIDHVGIYCGNNRFIHSSSPRCGGVIYSSLQEGYYANAYAGARRVIR